MGFMPWSTSKNLHFEKIKKCTLTVPCLYTARVFTGKNNLAKAEGRRERRTERERQEGRERERKEGFSADDDRGMSVTLTKERFIFHLFLKCSDRGGPLLLPTSSL